MNSKVNYSAIAIVFIFFVLSIFSAIFWLSKPTKQNTMQEYFIYFNESVSGLNIDSSIKYRGVNVGKVVDIQIDPNNDARIKVTTLIKKQTPIKENTTASLRPQGITGLSFIDLRVTGGDSKLLLDIYKDTIPIIQSKQSFFKNVEESFGSVSENLTHSLQRTSTALSQQNIENFSKILEHSAQFLIKFDALLDNENLQNVKHILANTRRLSQKLDKSIDNVNDLLDYTLEFEKSTKVSLEEITSSFESAKVAMKEIDRRNKNGDYSIEQSMGPPMQQLQDTMREFEQTLTLFNQLLIRFNSNPTMLLEKEQMRVGPGEKQ